MTLWAIWLFVGPMAFFGDGNTNLQKVYIDRGDGQKTVKLSVQHHEGEPVTLEINGEAFTIDPSEDHEIHSLTLSDGTQVEIDVEDYGVVLNEGGKKVIISTNGYAFSSDSDVHPIWKKDHVIISGAGKLDPETKERIINALRDAGVERDVVFRPGHGVIFLENRGDSEEY